jgi:transposase
MIEAVVERCAAIDVGKKVMSVTVMTGPANGEAWAETRDFGTTMVELKAARAWMEANGCTHVAMESTGTYWKPIFNVLEDGFRVVLANPQEIKARKGHKTDRRDSWWIAHLLRHAMITASFIPPRDQRQLRDLTRRRKKILHLGTSEKNRIEKVLQDANVKLSSVLSDIYGVSGQLMLEALLKGDASPAEIAAFAKGGAKKKIPDLIAALEQHRLSDHHRRMIQLSLDLLQAIEKQLLEIDELIREHIRQSGYQPQFELLQSLPGVQASTAAVVLAEVGPNVAAFPTEKKLSSWAGVCPGNNRSAGRSLSSSITQGNKWLKAALAESAWAVSRTKNGPLKDKFNRIAARSKPKAIVAVAHQLLILAYAVLQRGTPYEEQRGVPMSQERHARLIRHHVRRLGKLGIRIRVGSTLSSCQHPPSAIS